MEAELIRKMVKEELYHHEEKDTLRFDHLDNVVQIIAENSKRQTETLQEMKLTNQKMADYFTALEKQDHDRRIRDLEDFKNTFRGKVSVIVALVSALTLGVWEIAKHALFREGK